MTPAVPRISALLGSILALAACGIPASPSTSVQASATNEPSPAPELLAVVCRPAPIPFNPTDFDLTGAWAGDDGGIYYLRQVESVVWWNGMSGRNRSPLDVGREWNNVARGVINGLRIDVEGSDVPRGAGFITNGSLVLNIQEDGNGQHPDREGRRPLGGGRVRQRGLDALLARGAASRRLRRGLRRKCASIREHPDPRGMR
jgi:hypothetical protein